MDRNIRVALCGVGSIGGRIVRSIVLDHTGADVVAAFGHGSSIGMDVGVRSGIEPLGVLISNAKDMEQILREREVDVCVDAISGHGNDERKVVYEACARAHVNCITLAGRLYWPWLEEAEFANEMDRLFKENGVSLFAGGYEDLFWSQMITTLLGGVSRADVVSCVKDQYYDERSPLWDLKAHGAGHTPEEFEKEYAAMNGMPCAPGNVVGWLAHALKLTPLEHRVTIEPLIADRDLYVAAHDFTIPAGNSYGMYLKDTLATEEGITLQWGYRAHVRFPEDTEGVDSCTWTVKGMPDVEMRFVEDSRDFTATVLTNRIPHMINAPAGLVMSTQLPVNEYLSRPMYEYVR